MKIKLDDRLFQGTPVQIVQGMQSIAFFKNDVPLSEYIDWVVENTRRCLTLELVVVGETEAERAESLVLEMVRKGVAERV
jgi:hypothetical protein